MCLAGRVLALSVAALWLVGCETDQPTSVEQATATLDYIVRVPDAVSAVVYASLRVDTNGDGVPDSVIPSRGEVAVDEEEICAEYVDVRVSALVPWPVALEVSMLKAGTTDPILIESTQSPTGQFVFALTSQYDLEGTPLPDRPIDPPLDLGGARTAYAFTDGFQTHVYSLVYLTTCAGVQPGEIPDYRGTTISLSHGDLLSVMARSVPDPFGSDRALRFSVPLRVDGVEVEVNGTSFVDAPENGIAFTYLFN